MTLSKRLRDEVCSKLKIKARQLRNRISQKATEAGITDRDVALLLIAHELGLDVNKPRYEVPPEKIDKLNEYLRSQNRVLVPVSVPGRKKSVGKTKQAPFIEFIKYETEDPFVRAHIIETNKTYTHCCYTATFILCRKIIENLLTDIIRRKYPPNKKENVELYFDTETGRTREFSKILSNLGKRSKDFGPDRVLLERILNKAGSFKDDANNKAHSWYHIVKTKKELDDTNFQDTIDMIVKLDQNLAQISKSVNR